MIVVFALLAQSLFIVQRVAQTRNVVGQVTVQRGGAGEMIALVEGTPVQNGDVVRAGAKSSAEFNWQDGTRWKLLANSHLVIQKSLFNSLKKNEVSRLELEEGQMLVRVVKNLAPDSRFEIKTPTALVYVRGAVFSVNVQGGVTDVHVVKGRADVSRFETGETESENSGQKPAFAALESQSAHVSASGVRVSAAKNQREFLGSTNLLLPALDVRSRGLEGGATLIEGRTEMGNRVSINGENVPLLGNGVFVKRMKAQSQITVGTVGGWKIESTDRYGATTTTSVFKSPATVALAEERKCIARTDAVAVL